MVEAETDLVNVEDLRNIDVGFVTSGATESKIKQPKPSLRKRRARLTSIRVFRPA